MAKANEKWPGGTVGGIPRMNAANVSAWNKSNGCNIRWQCPTCGGEWMQRPAPGAVIESEQSEPMVGYCSQECEDRAELNQALDDND